MPSSRERKTTLVLSLGPFEAHLDGTRRRPPIGGGGQLDRDLPAILLLDETDQRLTDQILRPGAKQFAERAVRLLQAAETVDQRDADRRIGEKPLEPLARQPEGGLPLALGGQAGALFGDGIAELRQYRAPFGLTAGMLSPLS